jgi:hypothetical protein
MGSLEACRQYHDFRNMQGPFIPENHVWQWKDSRVDFWKEMMELAPELSRLALRIFHAPGIMTLRLVFNYIMLIFSREFCPFRAFLLN